MQPPSNDVSRNGWFRETQQVPLQNEKANYLAMLERSAKMRFKEIDPNDDPVFLAAIKETLKPKEKLMEWVARTGCSKQQALSFSKKELAQFIENAEANFAELEPNGGYIPQEKKVRPERYTMIG